jgi:hypothetical protein
MNKLLELLLVIEPRSTYRMPTPGVYRRGSCLATERLQIVRTRLGDRAGVVGAAALVLDQRLSPEAVDRQLALRAVA